VQDLPYGFRGIQNNLPALFGSIASAAGPAYFAFSALIAAITYFDQQSSKAAASTKSLYESFNKLKTETLSLGSIFSAVREGTLSAADATKIYNEKLGDLYGTAKNVYEAEQLYIKKTEGYIKAQYFRAKADIEYEKAKEALAKKDAAYAEDQVGILGRLATATASFFKAGAIQGVAGFYKQGLIYAKDAAEQQIELGGYVADYQEAQFQKSLALGEANLSKAYKIEQQYGIKSTEVKDKSNKAALAALAKSVEQQQRVNEQVLQNLIDAKKQEVKLFENDAYAKYEAGKQLIELEKKLALEKLKNSGYTAKQIAALEIGIYTERDNKLVLLSEALQVQLLTQDDKTRKEKNKRDKEELKNIQDAYKNQLAAFDQFYKDKLNLSSGDRQQQKVIYQQQASDLQYMFDNNLITSEDYIEKFGEIYKSWVTNNKAITNEAAKDLLNIGIGIMNALGPSLDLLLEKSANIGEVLSRAFNDIIKKLIKVTIAAAIAVALLSLIFPGTVAKAGGAGNLFGNLIGGGMGLGSNLFGSGTTTETPSVPNATTKKFANGGIISSPTYGLMGEYPGAASNPEVIAPLDKLQSLIGNAGGTLETRISGNDLVILMNKANRNNNNTF
jgi:hypothetical protein